MIKRYKEEEEEEEEEEFICQGLQK